MDQSLRAAVASWCARYGPGRLPRADHPDIGAGYAFAAAALVANVLFGLLLAALALALDAPLFGWLFGYSLAAVPFVLAAAFVAGALCWRRVAAHERFTGAFAGVVVTLCAYVVGVALLVCFLVAWQALVGPPPGGLGDDPLAVGRSLGGATFLVTCWLTLPLGAVAGHLHAWGRTQSTHA